MQCPWPGLELRLLDPKTSALTMRPLCLPKPGGRNLVIISFLFVPYTGVKSGTVGFFSLITEITAITLLVTTNITQQESVVFVCSWDHVHLYSAHDLNHWVNLLGK